MSGFSLKCAGFDWVFGRFWKATNDVLSGVVYITVRQTSATPDTPAAHYLSGGGMGRKVGNCAAELRRLGRSKTHPPEASESAFGKVGEGRLPGCEQAGFIRPQSNPYRQPSNEDPRVDLASEFVARVKDLIRIDRI